MAKMEQKLRAFFDEADADKTGKLTKLELCKILQKVGCKDTTEEIAQWFDEIDTNDDDQMTFEEMLTALNKRDPDEVTEADLRSTFKEWDTDNSGFVDVAEIKREYEERGIECDVDTLLEGIDKNSDGKVNIDEFLAAWRQNK